MGDSKGQQEPSMEDILSSIRRIISEDGEEVQEREQAAASDDGAGKDGQDDGVLELTDMVDEEGNVVELNESSKGDGGGKALAPEQAGEPLPAAEENAGAQENVESQDVPVPEPEETPAKDLEPLLSEQARGEITEAFSSLAQSVSSAGPADPSGLRVTSSGKTVEEHVVELLRPLLSEWLDKNLPTLVERLVEKEIAKLSRRADPL